MFFGGFPFGGMGGDEDEGPFSRGRGPQKEIDNTKYYELLGVDKNATKDEIKKAFRKKAIKEHPDKGGDPEKFKDITVAYEVLYDEEKRQMYDRYGEDGLREGGPGGAGGGMDLFDLLSGRRPGGGQPKVKRTKDILYPMKVNLRDIYRGKSAKMAVTRQRICSSCDGAGGDKKHIKTCPKCNGRGVRTQTISLGPGMYQQSTGPCDYCKGTGKIIPEEYKCKVCKGEGTKKEKKVLEVNVPKGAPDRHRITFFAEADELPGYQAGDIVFEIDIQEHAEFKRKGADLMMHKTVNLLEALTGFTFPLEHLDGKKVLISSSPGEIISPGAKKTVKELGLPIFNANYTYGNLFLTFEVVFPPSGSIKTEDLAKLQDIFKGYKKDEMDVDSKDLETFYAIDYSSSHHNIHQKKAGGAYDEDDDDEEHAGGQRVQCASQ